MAHDGVPNERNDADALRPGAAGTASPETEAGRAGRMPCPGDGRATLGEAARAGGPAPGRVHRLDSDHTKRTYNTV